MSISIILQIIGLILLFVGNLLISDAVTRWGAKTTKQWKIGNFIQALGFIFSLFATFLLIAVPNISIHFEKIIRLNYSDLLPILAIIVTVIVAIYSWSKSRVIYDIQRMKFAHKPGDQRTTAEKEQDEELRKMLNSGKWTMLFHYDLGPITNEHCNCIVLGKVKK